MNIDYLVHRIEHLIAEERSVKEDIKTHGPAMIASLVASGHTYKTIAGHVRCSIAYICDCSRGKKLLSKDKFIAIARLTQSSFT